MQLTRAGLAGLAVALLGVSACAAPLQHRALASPELPPASPSASPTPTAPLAASPVSFHGGEAGVAYAPVALSATGGLKPYKWSVTSGALPGGLAIGDDGSVAGTPTAAGTFSFTLQVTDAASSTASLPAASMAIAPAVALGLIASCAQYCRVELGCDSSCGAFGQVSGGAGPYNYSLAGGQLPAGTSLNGLSLGGTFKGQSGWLQFTVQVTDAFGGSASVSPKFWMYDHVSVSDGKCSSSYYPFPCSTSLPFSGGVAGTTYAVAVVSASGQMCTRAVTGAWVCKPTTSPPPMFSASVGNGAVNVDVPGQPTNPYEYSGNVILRLSDGDTCGSGVTCSATATVAVTFAGG